MNLQLGNMLKRFSGVVIRENRILSIIHDVLIMCTLVFNDCSLEILPSHYKVDLINGYQTQDALFCKASEEMTGSACGVNMDSGVKKTTLKLLAAILLKISLSFWHDPRYVARRPFC